MSLTVCSWHCLSRDGTSSPIPVPSGHLRLTGLGCELLTAMPAQLLALGSRSMIKGVNAGIASHSPLFIPSVTRGTRAHTSSVLSKLQPCEWHGRGQRLTQHSGGGQQGGERTACQPTFPWVPVVVSLSFIQNKTRVGPSAVPPYPGTRTRRKQDLSKQPKALSQLWQLGGEAWSTTRSAQQPEGRCR